MIRDLYAKRLSKSRLDQIAKELTDEDRHDLASELAIYRESLATLLTLEEKLREKHPGRDDLLLAVQAQQRDVINGLSKVTKTSHDIQTAADAVFTVEKVASLLDKVASYVVYHVRDERDRQLVLKEINDLGRLFRDTAQEGTFITPDQDALMMDATVPHEPDVIESAVDADYSHH